MGYWLNIGKAHVDYASSTGDSFPAELRPSIRCAHQDTDQPELIHTDAYDRAPGANRSISYGAWSDTLDAMPPFRNLMADLNEYATVENREFIPVEVYEDRLHECEREARAYLEDAITDVEEARAQRVLWFVAWSRKARELYGDHAAFETPGEWA